ncbi:unnamed protein product [Spirodela intermedia]|uniref:Uncharacterized protein n=1 Tax=Spirodela intermedia TaxID=51605 RepID=A0A7I8IGW6_SPIIN|nr:unnamed protein product [Spirodela intermedia]CAA6657119.1 unnamed protein product [Spirodela intermedia]
MLTCEDLEQSILADVKGMGSNVPDEIQEPLSTLNPNLELQRLMRTAKRLNNLEAMFTSGKHVGDIKADVSLSSARSYFPDDAETVSVESGKSLTLEALFGSAFMRELHSTEAPISEQRRLADDQVMAQSHSIPHPLGDTKIPSEYASKQENVNDIPGGRRSHTVGEAWIDLEQSRVKNFNAAAGQGSSSGIHLPEEESLISLGSCANPATSEIFHVEKYTQVDVTQNNERSSSVSVLEASVHGPHDAAWAEIAHQHLHGQSPPSQFPFSQINQMRPYLHHLDDPANRTPQMKFVGPENIHHDPQHRFLANVVHRHPFHGPGGPRFDPNFHLPIPPPPMPMPGGFAPHPLQYFPRGGPLPHTVNSMPVSMHEAMHNFQGHLNHGGYGMKWTAGISGHRPQLFARQMEMEAQQLNSQPPHLNPAGQSQVRLFDHELPPSLRYR